MFSKHMVWLGVVKKVDPHPYGSKNNTSHIDKMVVNNGMLTKYFFTFMLPHVKNS